MSLTLSDVIPKGLSNSPSPFPFVPKQLIKLPFVRNIDTRLLPYSVVTQESLQEMREGESKKGEPSCDWRVRVAVDGVIGK